MTQSSLKARTLPGGVAAAVLLLAGFAGNVCAAPPLDAGGVRYQREEVFAFTENPTCRKTGKDTWEGRPTFWLPVFSRPRREE